MSKNHDITTNIQNGRVNQQFTFPQQPKVQDALNQVVVSLGYPTGCNYALSRFSKKKDLEGQCTYVSYKIEDFAGRKRRV